MLSPLMRQLLDYAPPLMPDAAVDAIRL